MPGSDCVWGLQLTGQRQPSKDSPKALSGLSFRPNPCPLSACQGALGCHLPEPGDVTGKECGGWGRVRGLPERRLSPHLQQANRRQCDNSELPPPPHTLQGPWVSPCPAGGTVSTKSRIPLSQKLPEHGWP